VRDSRTPAPATPARVLLTALGVLLLLGALYGGRMTQFTFLDTGIERFHEALSGLVLAAALGVAGAACLRLAVGRGPWVLWLIAGAVPAIWEAALHLGA
jgi:hypothetical protein